MSAERPRFSLALLGGCAVARPDGELLAGRVSQRRRLACLAVVAASGRAGVSRDRLLALLWPESTTEQARHRLADTLHVLRAALGEDALPGVGDRLTLNPDVVACDAVAFDHALRRGDVAAAAAAYAGAFLDGFHVGDAPEFERWADGERDRLAREAARAFEDLAEQRAAAGDRLAAIAWWRRLVAHDPYSARGIVRLVQALDAAGDRVGAVRQAEVYAALMRDALGAEPDPEVLALAERLRGPAAGRAHGLTPDAARGSDAAVPSAASRVPAATATAPASAPLVVPPPPAVPKVRRRTRTVTWLIGSLVVLVAGLTAVRGYREPSRTAPMRARFALTAAPGEQFAGVRGVTISPDGRLIAYAAADSSGVRRLRVRRLDDLRAHALPGTEGAYAPFFSPDGRWIGYFDEGGLFKVPVAGGAPVLLVAGTRNNGANWGPGGAILLGMGRSSVHGDSAVMGLTLVSPDGRVVRPLTTPDAAHGDLMHHFPVVLSDGETVLFESVPPGAGTGSERGYIGVASLATGTHTVLPLPGRYPLGVVDGRLLYAGTDGALMAVSFDVARRRLTGEPVRLDEPADLRSGQSFSVLAEAGTLVSTHADVATARPVLVDARANDGRGAREPPVPLLEAGERTFASPRYAPDGRRIAFQVGQSFPGALWVYDLSAHTFSRIAPATTEGAVTSPAWTPDGRLLYSSTPGIARDTWGIWMLPADGGARAQQLFTEHGIPEGTVVSPNGRTVLYGIVNDTAGLRRDLRVVDLPGGAPRAWLATPFDEFSPAFSHDGRWVAYVSDETGRREVYVRPFADTPGRVQVSADGGTEPCWSPDGRRIFYRAGRRLLAARVTYSATQPGLVVVAREVLVDGDFLAGTRVRDYDVAPDGRHIVMLQTAPSVSPEVVVAVDWLGEVHERMLARH